MKKINKFALALIGLTQISLAQNAPQLGEDSLDEVIDSMTSEEKASLLVGPGMPGYAGLTPLEGEPEVRVLGAAGGTKAIPRLGIPETVFADGPAGLRIQPLREKDERTYYATAFPVGTSLASTWNVDLIEEVGRAIGNEVREYGVDVLLAPALNIHRNPLNGRNFEYFSEDPLVSGKIAAAYVRGVQSNGVGTSLKHYAANNQETNRLKINAHITERAMREIYLRGFEIAVKEAQPWTIMSSYSKINGTYASSHEDLLTTVLRDEWNFKGVVMTDWFGGYPGFESIRREGAVSDVVAQIEAGNDLLMPGMELQRERLQKAIEEGSISEEAVRISLKRIFNMILQSPTFQSKNFTNTPELEAHAEITRQAASEGMILLKNDENILPFKEKSAPIAVFGLTSYNFISGGTGSGDVNEEYTISLIDGLTNMGYKIDQDLKQAYVPYVEEVVAREMKRRQESGGLLAAPQRLPEMPLDQKLVNEKAQTSEVAVITIGRNSGEHADRKIQEDFYLAKDEIEMIDHISEAFHAENKKVIVILNIGGVIETASWKDKVDAILLAWQPGQEGGNSVADVFSGNVNPSGKLTMTFPVEYAHHASAKNWLGTPENNPQEVFYEEDIYVGYRYFNSFGIKPSYEFGFGGSYTTFDYSDLHLSSSIFTDELTVRVKVTNTGKTAGKEVVQLYLSAPANMVDKPESELKAFGKTQLLDPGSSETLTFTLDTKNLASFIDDRNAWIAEKGTYIVKIGASSMDLKLEETFSIATDIVAEEVHEVFDLDTKMETLKN